MVARLHAFVVKTVCIGGGPAGLYFAILTKKRHPQTDVCVYERNADGDTFGFGVVFSDATMDNLAQEDAESYAEIRKNFYHWNDINVVVVRPNQTRESFRSRGHGFSGLSRKTLLDILQKRALELGVTLHFETVIDAEGRLVDGRSVVDDAGLVLYADGVNSIFRERHARQFLPSVDLRPNRFVWLGTTFPFEEFTFWFKENEAGTFCVHAYRYEEGRSTFIVECSPETFDRTGLQETDEVGTARYFERLFSDLLEGHRLLTNRSIWRRFPVISNHTYYRDSCVLLGDALHTAHFSIGSGTKLAMEDSIVLRRALDQHPQVSLALQAFERERRAPVASLQRAAQVSLEWFEHVERALRHDGLTFVFSLLTRSLRVNHDNLRKRDPELLGLVDAAFEKGAFAEAGAQLPSFRKDHTLPPMFTPFCARDMLLPNRIVLPPINTYRALDGSLSDFHLVHYGSRMLGGAGLVLTEVAAISQDARMTEACLGLYRQEHVEPLRRLVQLARDSGTKIGLVLGHAGRRGAVLPPDQGEAPLPAERQWPLLSASALPWTDRHVVPKEMSEQDMARVRQDFALATERAATVGFDCIELDAADGHLLASFLSPLTNRRSDRFGGPIEQRMKFVLEVFAAMRARFPSEKPMSVRLSASDFCTGGITLDEVKIVTTALKAEGCSFISVACGYAVSPHPPDKARLAQVPFADFVRNETPIPTLAMGGISSIGDANAILAARRADLCGVGRAQWIDPNWVRNAARTFHLELPSQAPYAATR